MIQIEFTGEMKRILETFGDRQYNVERVKLIWKHCEQLDLSEMRSIVDHFISNSRFAPTPEDFKKAAHEEIKNGWNRKRTYQTLYSPQDSTIDCQWCGDTGFCYIEEPESKFKAWMACNCPDGAKHSKNILQYKKQFEPLFNRKPFPKEWFVPDKNSNGDIVFGSIQNKINEFQRELKTSKTFWENYISEKKKQKEIAAGEG